MTCLNTGQCHHVICTFEKTITDTNITLWSKVIADKLSHQTFMKELLTLHREDVLHGIRIITKDLLICSGLILGNSNVHLRTFEDSSLNILLLIKVGIDKLLVVFGEHPTKFMSSSRDVANTSIKFFAQFDELISSAANMCLIKSNKVNVLDLVQTLQASLNRTPKNNIYITLTPVFKEGLPTRIFERDVLD